MDVFSKRCGCGMIFHTPVKSRETQCPQCLRARAQALIGRQDQVYRGKECRREFTFANPQSFSKDLPTRIESGKAIPSSPSSFEVQLDRLIKELDKHMGLPVFRRQPPEPARSCSVYGSRRVRGPPTPRRRRSLRMQARPNHSPRSTSQLALARTV